MTESPKGRGFSGKAGASAGGAAGMGKNGGG